MANICRHCFVSGLVQGVFFRQHTQDRAIELGVTGWVKNIPDGRVEALLCGEEKSVHNMLEWLHQGSPSAEVSGVEVLEHPLEQHSFFDILR